MAKCPFDLVDCRSTSRDPLDQHQPLHAGRGRGRLYLRYGLKHRQHKQFALPMMIGLVSGAYSTSAWPERSGDVEARGGRTGY
jgi:hypothetical protein